MALDLTRKTVLDKDLKKYRRFEKATRKAAPGVIKLGIGSLFLLVVLAFLLVEAGTTEGGVFIIIAGVIGGYMALNIGANDVANNVGPAVGSQALTMVGALIIAAIFEAAGAILAGGDVVATISKGIIAVEGVAEPRTFIWVMTAALLAAAVWLNLATYIGAPVSTTHAIVGGVLGAGLAAAGVEAVNWPTMGAIAASWIISPFLGAIVAAIFLAIVKFMIVFKEDKVAAARRWVPILVAIMASVFSVYLVMKGLKRVWQPDPLAVVLVGAVAFAVAYGLVRPLVRRAAGRLENTRKSVSQLFTVPLICSAALLSFAHGSNDVANAVGPLAAIVSTVATGTVSAQVSVPLWVMVVGAFGISAGLILFGPKIVRVVGEKITKLDRMRAFTVALSAAITVIVASGLGLPVSSTHIAVGAVFGVGFFREFLVNRRRMAAVASGAGAFLADERGGGGDGDLVEQESLDRSGEDKRLRKKRKKARKRKLVRRRYLVTIVAAWLITVPAAGAMAAFFYFTLRGFFMP